MSNLSTNLKKKVELTTGALAPMKGHNFNISANKNNMFHLDTVISIITMIFNALVI